VTAIGRNRAALVAAVDLARRASTCSVGTDASIRTARTAGPTVVIGIEFLAIGAHALAIGAGRIGRTHDPARPAVTAIGRDRAALVVAIDLARRASTSPIGTHPPVGTSRPTAPAVGVGVDGLPIGTQTDPTLTSRPRRACLPALTTVRVRSVQIHLTAIAPVAIAVAPARITDPIANSVVTGRARLRTTRASQPTATAVGGAGQQIRIAARVPVVITIPSIAVALVHTRPAHAGLDRRIAGCAASTRIIAGTTVIGVDGAVLTITTAVRQWRLAGNETGATDADPAFIALIATAITIILVRLQVGATDPWTLLQPFDAHAGPVDAHLARGADIAAGIAVLPILGRIRAERTIRRTAAQVALLAIQAARAVGANLASFTNITTGPAVGAVTLQVHTRPITVLEPHLAGETTL